MPYFSLLRSVPSFQLDKWILRNHGIAECHKFLPFHMCVSLSCRHCHLQLLTMFVVFISGSKFRETIFPSFPLHCHQQGGTTGKAAYNGGGKSAPPFRNIEIIRYRYLSYKHPYMGSTKSIYHFLSSLTSPSNPSASNPSHDALKAFFHEF